MILIEKKIIKLRILFFGCSINFLAYRDPMPAKAKKIDSPRVIDRIG